MSEVTKRILQQYQEQQAVHPIPRDILTKEQYWHLRTLQDDLAFCSHVITFVVTNQRNYEQCFQDELFLLREVTQEIEEGIPILQAVLEPKRVQELDIRRERRYAIHTTEYP